MGILNTTPDSFSDGGLHTDLNPAVSHAMMMISEGADIIDVGGESTRPGAAAVSLEVELERTIPVIRVLRKSWDGFISIDTSKAVVASAALAAGADIVNDVTGFQGDPAMPEVCAAAGCGVVVMHMQGNPATMQTAPAYGNLIPDIMNFFEERLSALSAAGIDLESVCLDPGIGFGKSHHHNLEILRELDRFQRLNRPIMVGLSRKSFIGRILRSSAIEDREWPTVALTSLAREKGAMVHRVHSVKTNRQALRMTEAILATASP